MDKPLQVGITGGIGSGKSTIAKIFSCLGVPIYDADTRAKELMNSDPDLIKQIKLNFGEESYDEGSSLNRKYLAAHVFGFPDRLEKINALVHPCVARDYERWVLANSSCSYLLKEAALLFESGSAKTLDKIIVVSAPESVRVGRVMKRDNRSEQEVKTIISRQLPEEEIIKRADYVITNDETSLIIPQVLDLHNQFSTIQ